jgi:hypothetical protein
MLDSLLHMLEETSIAVHVREDAVLFPWIETVHVLALTLVFGFIAMVDLRLIGIASRERSVMEVSAHVLPLTWIAFAFAVVSGALLFTSNAVAYAHNVYFQIKIALLLLAGVNMLVLHVTSWRRAAQWHTPLGTARAAKIAGAISLLLWLAIVVCGRWIGFTLGPTT